MMTVVVYSTLLILMLTCMSIASYNERISLSKGKICRWEIFFTVIVFALLFGMRYDVGEDHLRYLESYLQPYIYKDSGVEPIFKFIGDTFKFLNIHPIFYFAFFAGVQIFCLLYFLKDDKRLYPWVVLVLIMGQFFLSWMNGIRQDMAACIFLCATTCIIKRKFLGYLVFLIICIGFHYSAIILFPLYFLFYKEDKSYVGGLTLQILALSIASVVAIMKIDLLPYLGDTLEMFTNIVGYQEYSENVLMRYTELTRTGLSMYLSILIDFIIVVNYSKLKQYFSGSKFNVVYNLYFWGSVFQILFINNLVLARPFRYFRNFKMIIIAYLLCYLCSNLKSNRNVVYFALTILSLFLLYVATLINEPFKFMPL